MSIELLVVVVVSDDPLYFCGVSCNFFFISNFIGLSLFLNAHQELNEWLKKMWYIHNGILLSH